MFGGKARGYTNCEESCVPMRPEGFCASENKWASGGQTDSTVRFRNHRSAWAETLKEIEIRSPEPKNGVTE